jgi:hypothetical protein
VNRRRAVLAALAVGAAVLLGACSGGGGSPKGFTQSVSGEDGISGRVDMDHPKVPKDFPTLEVPLPTAGKLQAVVSGRQKPNHFYTFTYSLAGQDGRRVGADYRRALEKASFKIKNYSSTGGSDGGFTTFDATSPKWDVTVVSGKGSLLEAPAISVQVTTHGTLSDDLQQLDVLDNGGDPQLDPNDPNAATSTTTIPLNGG